ncbi:MAG: hypothetical protein JWQ07_1008 [Ramlibacter sp.]|nr:hypothetical protein [Ramlibacter sp.]
MIQPPRRLFIGLIPERPIQLQIQRHCREWAWPTDARPERFGRYHITLHFLGDVGLGPEHLLRRALRKVAVEPLELELCVPEVWRNNVAVLRPANHDGLQALYDRIALVLPATGLQPSQPQFKPHVTLARNAGQATPPAATKPIRWRVNEFVLVWSVLFPQAKPARYEIVERFGATPGQALSPPATNGQQGEQLPLL